MTDAPWYSENPLLDLAAYRYGAREATKRAEHYAGLGYMVMAQKHRNRAEWYLDRARMLEEQIKSNEETNAND